MEEQAYDNKSKSQSCRTPIMTYAEEIRAEITITPEDNRNKNINKQLQETPYTLKEEAVT